MGKSDHKILILQWKSTRSAPEEKHAPDNLSAKEGVKRWDFRFVSEGKKRRLLGEISATLETLLVRWKGNTLTSESLNEAVQEFNHILSSTTNRILAGRNSKKGSTQSGPSIPHAVQNMYPRAIRTLTSLRHHLLALSTDPRQARIQISTEKHQDIIRNAVQMNLIPAESWHWTAEQFKEWLEQIPDMINLMRQKKRFVARQLIARQLRPEVMFQDDRANFYDVFVRGNTPHKVTKIENKDGKILTGKAAVNHIRQHMANTFGDGRNQPTEQIEWVDRMYSQHRATVDPAIFAHVMDVPTREDIRRVIMRTGNGKTGHMGISNDLLKVLICMEAEINSDVVIDSLHTLISTIFRHGRAPHCIRSVQMKMIPKHASPKPDVNSLRPISIIPELSKIISKILARRIMDRLTKHPDTLHPAQRGFLRHGNIHQCIDTLIDILEDKVGRDKRGLDAHLHLASYDQRKAYDSVQHYTIRMSLERLNFPTHFVEYVMSTLTGATAQLLTDMGTSQPFPLLTSVKQGDPLAPLLFIFVVDVLHVGLDKNPLHNNSEYGYLMQGSDTRTASTAFADDFTVTSNSWVGLQHMHEWIREFFRYHRMDINSDKSFWTCDTREKKDHLTGLHKELGEANSRVPYRDPAEAWRHLGVLIDLNLSWKEQRNKMQSHINMFRAQCRRNRLNTLMRATATWEYLLPKLDIGLKHANIPPLTLTKWDSELRCLVLQNTSMRSKHSLCKAAFHIITNIPSIKLLQDIVQTAELHIRLNSRQEPSSKTLWTRLFAESESKEKAEAIEYLNGDISHRSVTWLHRAANAMQRLNISATFNRQPWYKNAPDTFEETELSKQIFPLQMWQEAEGKPYRRVESTYRGLTSTQVTTAYTDGSTPVGERGCSGIGVLIQQQGHTEIKIAEPFKTSGNNYAAELMAILLAMRVTPINAPLTIFTDSLSAVQGLEKEFDYVSERTWSRTPARPLVRSIHFMRKLRSAPTELRWIRAHTNSEDPHSIGNGIADTLANQGRAKGEGMRLPEFKQNENDVIFGIVNTPLQRENKHRDAQEAKCEPIHIPGDVRKEAKREAMRQLLNEWMKRRKHGELVRVNPTDTVELCQIMRRQQDNGLLEFYLQALTQTADTHDRRRRCVNGKETDKNALTTQRYALYNSVCLFCNFEQESLRHIYSCTAMQRTFREQIALIIQQADPHHLLQDKLQWFIAEDEKTRAMDLWPVWKQAFPTTSEQEEIVVREALANIQQHDRFAGLLGIQPQGLRELYSQYHLHTDNEPAANAVHLAHKKATQTIRELRLSCMKLAYTIWKTWRERQRTVLRRNKLRHPKQHPQQEQKTQQQQHPAVCKKPSPKLSSLRYTTRTPKKRFEGRDKNPRLHRVKKKYGRR